MGGLKGSAVPRNPVHCCTGPVLRKVKGDLQIPHRMILRQVPDRGIMAVIRFTVAKLCKGQRPVPFFYLAVVHMLHHCHLQPEVSGRASGMRQETMWCK